MIRLAATRQKGWQGKELSGLASRYHRKWQTPIACRNVFYIYRATAVFVFEPTPTIEVWEPKKLTRARAGYDGSLLVPSPTIRRYSELGPEAVPRGWESGRNGRHGVDADPCHVVFRHQLSVSPGIHWLALGTVTATVSDLLWVVLKSGPITEIINESPREPTRIRSPLFRRWS